jgi:hypothetical protein
VLGQLRRGQQQREARSAPDVLLLLLLPYGRAFDLHHHQAQHQETCPAAAAAAVEVVADVE